MFYNLNIFQQRHASLLQDINCFFNFFSNSSIVFESFIFFGNIFGNIAPLMFGEFIKYFVVSVAGKFTILPLLRL